MPAMAWIDGVVTPLAEARVPVTDRGFLWGDHACEVLRVEGRAPCDLDPHLDRLAASAALIGLAAPDRGRIAAALAALVAAAAEPASSVRVLWTRGDARGMAPAAAGPPRLVLMLEPLAPAPAGVRLCTLPGPRIGGLVPVAAKTGNSLGSVLALAAATAAGADDALLVDDAGAVLETATANLFVVERDGAIVTPVGALLPGVTAARVAALLAAAGHPVAAARVGLERARAAAELFVTSARRGPVPVVALDGVARAAGPITALAIAAYARWIQTCGQEPEPGTGL